LLILSSSALGYEGFTYDLLITYDQDQDQDQDQEEKRVSSVFNVDLSSPSASMPLLVFWLVLGPYKIFIANILKQ